MLLPSLSEYIKQKVLILFSFSRMNVHRKPRGERMTLAATVPKKKLNKIIRLTHYVTWASEPGRVGFPRERGRCLTPLPDFFFAKIDIILAFITAAGLVPFPHLLSCFRG